MGNFVGNVLAKLIRDLSYAKGAAGAIESEVKALEAKIAPLASELKKRKTELRAANRRLAKLEVEISQRASLPLEQVRSMQRWPKRRGLSYGTFKRELVAFLTAADGPVSTNVIMDHLAEQFGISRATSAERKHLRIDVRKRLRELAEKGAVERLPGPPGSTHRTMAEWRWIGV